MSFYIDLQNCFNKQIKRHCTFLLYYFNVLTSHIKDNNSPYHCIISLRPSRYNTWLYVPRIAFLSTCASWVSIHAVLNPSSCKIVLIVWRNPCSVIELYIPNQLFFFLGKRWIDTLSQLFLGFIA